MMWLNALIALIALLITALIVYLTIRSVRNKQRYKKSVSERNNYLELLKSNSSAMWYYDFETDKLFMCHNDSGSSGGEFFEVPDFRTAPIQNGTVHPTSADTFRRFFEQIRTGMRSCNCEIQMKSRSGQYRWYSAYGVLLTDARQRPTRFLGQVMNINDKQQEIVQLKQRSNTDGLTKLYTRHHVKKLVNDMLNEHPGLRGSLLLIDIDRFRSISETNGAKFGNALLMEFSETLRSIFPQDAILGRINCDEFVAFVPNVTGAQEIGSYANNCCSCLMHYFLNPEQTERVTCSVGVAVPSEGEPSSYEQLYYRADVALYVAKFSGRNTYKLYQEDMDTQLTILAGDSGLAESDESFEYEEAPALSNASLLSQVIEMLFESTELSSTINLILTLIGRRMDFDYCGILECDEPSKTFNFTYSWYSDRFPAGTVLPESRSAGQMSCMVPLIEAGGAYLYCKSMDDLTDEQHEGLVPYINAGINSFIQCPVRDGKDITGMIGFGVFDKNRVLGEETIKEVTMICRIVGGYLRQLRTKQNMEHLGEVDRLTGVMTVTPFITEACRIMSENPRSKFAILYVDVDRFKFINDTYGYKAGDDILIRMTQIINSIQGHHELLARIGADQFVMMFEYEELEILKQRLSSCEQMINSIKKTETDCYKLPLRAGVYLAEQGDLNITSMIDKANLARKSIKSIHISTYSLFDDSMKSRIKKQKEIEDVMRDALKNDEFVVYFQPKFSLLKGQLVGAEALVRWNRPGIGLISPDEFIPIFEDNGFIVDLDFYVLEKVCAKVHRDLQLGLDVKPISVNFSRVHINTKDFIQRLQSYLYKYEIPANLIEIEITESAMTENEDYLVEIMQALHKLGLVISMDDFGSGYSSLNLLRKLPFDVLKLDKDFFNANDSSERERLIIANIVNMAKELNIRVVSEGVETPEQAEFLREINCDQAQGFLYARPMDMESFERLYQHSDD